MQKHVKAIILSSRPPFLLLTPVCVLLGFGMATYLQAHIHTNLVWWVLIGALAAHISVNLLNEYTDFKSGLDFKTSKTAFSGGSGALPNHPESAHAVLILGIVALLFTMIVGLYLIAMRGSVILPIGIIGIVIIVTYTQWLNRIPLLCLIAPGIGFGVLMVVGTYIVLIGEYNSLVGQVSLIPFLLINNLLLLNQYPDITADASIGRKTLPIRYGIPASNCIYGLFTAASYGLIVYYIYIDQLPTISLLALLPIMAAAYALYGAVKYKASLGEYSRYLAANVIAAIVTPLLLGITLLVA